MDEITLEQIQTLRRNFDEKVKSQAAEFCPQDLERVKIDNLWLRRFLAHADSEKQDALTMLYDTCQWRKDFGTNELNESKIPPRMFEKGVLFSRNQDKWGKKLLVFKAKNHTKGTEEIEVLQKFIVYHFERIEREAKSDQISIVFDMKDTGWNNMDMDFVRYLITLLKTYYPFFVNYLVIFEMPWLLNAAWKIIKGWLPPNFVDHVKFLDKKTMKDYIDEDSQLAEWGGKDNYQYKFEPEVRQKRKGESNGLPPEPRTRKNSYHSHSSNSEVMNHSFDSGRSTPRVIVEDDFPDDGNGQRREVHQLTFNSESSTPSPSISTPLLSMSESIRGSETHVLAEVDSSILFQPTENEDYMARLRIRNIAPGSDSLIFKIKTTSPDKYRVRPTIAIVEPSATALIVITTHAGVSAATMQRDRFQVQVTRVPPNSPLANHDGEGGSGGLSNFSNFNELSSYFKGLTNASGAIVETYRVSCPVEARPGDTGGSGSGGNTISMNEENMRKGLSDLEKKITESVCKNIDPRLARVERMSYFVIILVIFLLFLGVLLYFKMPSESVIQTQTCSGPVDSVTWSRSLSPDPGSSHSPDSNAHLPNTDRAFCGSDGSNNEHCKHA